MGGPIASSTHYIRTQMQERVVVTAPKKKHKKKR